MKLFAAIPIAIGVLMALACTPEPIQPEPPTSMADSVFFYEQRLFSPGDYGSTNYRIPAIMALPDGSLLAVNDKRKYNETDLPEDIDVVARRSTDNGRTWTEPITIAQGTGRKHGYGDPALVTTASGDIICAFAGGNGFWASTVSDPIRTFVCRSNDGGATWSTLTDITFTIWGPNSDNVATRNYLGGFFASGNGLRLQRGPHAGRIMFVTALHRPGGYVADNFVVYSDDEGYTWHVSDKAYIGGDEAKVIELTDGSILMSVRQNGARGYNISTDGGVTWGTQGRWPEMTTNACNGELLRYSAVDQGGSRNILLHSIPNSMNRENVSIFVSYDEGKTWQDPVSLYTGPSVYSSLTLLSDGTIGCYLEKNPNGACELWYQNFSFAWLLSQLEK